MADKWTPQQEAAVKNRGGRLLVSAAAGSGKTKVLVDRLMQYLTDPNDPADLDEFLIITYTKAAASELRGKIAAKLTEKIAEEPENRQLQKQMQRLFLTKISTVHGFCADILRQYAYRLDIAPDFRVGDENECRELRENVMTELLDSVYDSAGMDEDFRVFVDTQGMGRSDYLVPEIVEKVYNSAMCHLDPELWLQKCLDATTCEGILDAAQTPWGEYLMEDLHETLDAELRVLEICLKELGRDDAMEKFAVHLNAIAQQLRQLRACNTWDGVVANRNIDYGRFPSVRKNIDQELKERVKAAKDACKKALDKKLRFFTDPSEQILLDVAQTAAASRGLISLVRKFDAGYRQAKRSRRVLDFSDLEHRTLDILLGKDRSAPTATAREIGARFREIMVDEYQDSNAVQDAIFNALTRERNNCFLVGDVKQSIYQFRLADPEIFLKKYNSYAPAEEAKPGEGRKVLLSHNFRSGVEVIEGVNHVFRSCMSPRVGGLHYGDAEELKQWIPTPPLGRPGVELHVLYTEEDKYSGEAAYVAREIEKLLAEKTPIRTKEGFRPVEPDDIVILLRSPGSTGLDFQLALEARGIRCRNGSDVDLLQTEEVGTFRAFLQTIVNPRQDIPLISTLASPVFGFSADDLADFRSKQKKGPVYDALWESDLPKAKEFVRLLSELRQEARVSPLTQLLESCLRRTRMDSIYGAMAGGGARKNNLQAFYQLAAEYEMGTARDLGQFLEHLEALEERGLTGTVASAAGAVTIMSIHKSKGLEFPVVFLAGLSKKFNKEDLKARILCDKELGIGLSVADPQTRIRYPSAARRAIAAKMEAQSVSEEMRVLYVAMTRARDVLVMTYGDKNPEAMLANIALRLDFDRGELLTREAANPGTWVLIAAMQRMEAGALHAIGGRPARLSLSDYPWKICVADAAGEEAVSRGEEKALSSLPKEVEEKLQKALSFRYDHIAATQAPSKLTATALKGRFKDAEAAENTRQQHAFQRSLRRPSFLGAGTDRTAFGNAMHAALEYIRYERCGSEEAIREEVADMVSRGLLTQEQGELVDCGKLTRFFETPIGQKLMTGVPHVREFKFSILEDGAHYDPDLAGEQILLQGVADCALLEEDGITVLDFKTDYVTEETVDTVVDKYRPQVNAYAGALSRIFEKPVKEKYLYLVRLNRFIAV